MNTSRIAVIASVLAAVFWAAKAVAIGAAGGLGRSPAENPLFFLGLTSCVVAVVTLAVCATPRRAWWVRSAVGVAVVLGLFVVVGLIDSAAHAVVDGDHWVLTELNLWIAALVVLGVSVVRDRRQRSAPAVRREAEPSGALR